MYSVGSAYFYFEVLLVSSIVSIVNLGLSRTFIVWKHLDYLYGLLLNLQKEILTYCRHVGKHKMDKWLIKINKL